MFPRLSLWLRLSRAQVFLLPKCLAPSDQRALRIQVFSGIHIAPFLYASTLIAFLQEDTMEAFSNAQGQRAIPAKESGRCY